MKLSYSLADFFIAYTITQTNVHDSSRSISAQSVNENGYDYNSTKRFTPREKR
ncbi:ferredoxin [Salmonella enterica subsp. diarizonae]|nr:ferredoxin [Salmonella enterica subsp. diarizonae]ECI4304133.1 ferredoxin [Salmonella enterica subsp. diarizonae]ECI5311207.1 ferredoxin [Salmonella enterica subsp. diarizonae]